VKKTVELEVVGVEVVLEDGSHRKLSKDEIGRWMAALLFYKKMQAFKKKYRRELETQKLISELLIKMGLVSERNINWNALPLIALDHVLRSEKNEAV
jgi:hypothetical protein